LKTSRFHKRANRKSFIFEYSKLNEWLPLLDAFVCKELAQDYSRILEIGVHRGGWLITLAENNLGTTGIGVDPYPNNDSLRDEFLRDISRRNLVSRIFLYPSWAELISGPHKQMKFKMIHIDGVHDESNVTADLIQADEMLDDEGIIVVDDIFYHSFPGVTSATFNFILEFEYAPFLFTQKKIYLCKQNAYSKYYSDTQNLFETSSIPYVVDQKLSGDHSGYSQSNAIHGYSLIITDIDLSSKKTFLRTNQIPRRPFSLKELIRQLLPPVLLDVAKFLKSKLS
jgi:hypothetical protein